jgi:hypothetical protein
MKKRMIVMLVVFALIPQLAFAKLTLWDVVTPAMVKDMAHHIMEARQGGLPKDKMIEICHKQFEKIADETPKFKKLFSIVERIPVLITEDAFKTPIRDTTFERKVEVEAFAKKWENIAIGAKEDEQK